MGSVGSGVAGEQEFAMKSVGTRTTLPRGPPLSRHIPPSNRLHIPPSASEESSEERGGTSNTTDRGQLNMARASANANGAGGASLDVCGNVVGHGAETKNHDGGMKGRDGNNSRQQRDSRTPPKILSVSGKVEQVKGWVDGNGQNSGKNTSALVRPSAFKPVVPKSFHSMQNLLAQSGGGGQSGGSGGGSDAPQSLCEQDSLDRDPTTDALSDSARNSLSSLPTYTGPGLGGYGSGPGLVVYGTSAPPSSGMGPLSASTSHINRLTTTTVPPAMDEGNNKPKYQNGYSVSQSQNASVSESGQSSSGKSCVSYQRLCQRPEPNTGEQDSPSTEDIIQDLEDRLWEKEQEVLHMRRSLDRSEAAIVQVFEEKQRVWEREMADLRQNYSSRLQQLSQRSQRSQHSLQIHMSRLQQDKRRLQEEISALLELRQELERKCLEYRKEQADMLPRLEESKWELCQKVGEISLLKQQLRESQAEVTQRAGETVALRGQIKELNAQLKEREEAMMGLKESYNSKSRELERCEGELKRTLAEVMCFFVGLISVTFNISSP
ncbi:hypothetical protein DNTS_014548 [Danionella cerebrum]|uniref:Leucine zipper tumor suppressor 3 n=1 Tax=Danionella cerebrum TaxID=2873325 RepID=A0A553RLV3_9TELE|nr:hypothetical protein DNTS_014548 [Danionella translucida]